MSSRLAFLQASLLPIWAPESSALTMPLSWSPYLVIQSATTCVVFSASSMVVCMSRHFIFGAIFFNSVTGAKVREKKGDPPGMCRTTQ